MAKINAEGVQYTITSQDQSGPGIASAKRNFKDFGDASENAFNRAKNSWAMMTAGFASALYIFNQVKGYAAYFTDAYLEQEKASNRLSIAMKNMHDYSIEARGALVDFASELQRSTAISDEASLGVMALLKTFGMSDEVLKKTTASVLDLSVGMEIDLQTAAKMMGKAFIGETGTLGRFGIKVDETKFGVERFNDILSQVQQRFGGFAQSELDTYSGRWTNLKNRIGDAAEAVGKFILDMTHGGPLIDRQTRALQINNETLVQTEFGYMRFTNEISPKVIEELRKEGDAWNYLNSEMGKFTPIADETLKAIEKLRMELIKIKLETKFVGADEFVKKLGMVELELEPYKKAELPPEEIEKLRAAKILQIRTEQKEAFRKLDLKSAEEYAVNWGKRTDAAQDALDEIGKAEADAMGNWDELNLKSQEENINSWEMYWDKRQEIEKAGMEYLIGSEKEFADFIAGLMEDIGQRAMKRMNEAVKAQSDAMDFYLNRSKEKYAEAWAQMMGMANLIGGEAGAGMGQMAASLKGVMDIQTGQDQYSKEIDAQTLHYFELQNLYAQHLISKKQLSLAYAEKEVAINEAMNMRQLTTYSNMLGMMAGAARSFYALSGQQSEVYFRVWQAFQTAQVAIDTYKMAISGAAALAGIPYVGPALALAWKVTAFAMGAAAIASIWAQKPGGAMGISGGAAGGYVQTTPTEPTWVETKKEEKAPIVVNLYVYGSVVDHDKFTRELIPSLTKAYEDNVH